MWKVRTPGNSVGVAFPQPRVEVRSASTLGAIYKRWSNAEPKVTGAALCDAVTAIEDGMPLDVAAVDLSAALDALGEITGETMSERVIDEVFAKFCVGK